MEAMFSAEQGRAQGLKDLIELNYAFERSDAGSRAENGTVNELLSYLPSNTVLMAFGKNELIFWVCQKGKDVELRKKPVNCLGAHCCTWQYGNRRNCLGVK